MCGGGAQLGEDSCDTSELKICVEAIPRTPVGLPRNKAELDAHCSARDEFMTCVTYVGRSCSNSGGTLLRRMAWVLAQDVAACSQQPRAYCSAPSLPFTTPLLATITGVILYPARL
ncbi:unnamed protein product [Parnassius mnemosyne]|uniref:Uncharacterized protein n=1 Tax=Parnassius mnemosyne TaxID=213953 RepID=A0AAV1KQY7_9NEOP